MERSEAERHLIEAVRQARAAKLSWSAIGLGRDQRRSGPSAVLGQGRLTPALGDAPLRGEVTRVEVCAHADERKV